MTNEIVETKAIETVRLGTIEATNYDDVIYKATGMAKSLAKIIEDQSLSKVIGGRRYVYVEGWSTLGAMMGILPREVEVIEHDNGDFEATVELIRASDGEVIGRASSIVGFDEAMWQSRPRYARRSMCVTRATGKAFRLLLSWIIKLAGYEPTPAEEMDGVVEASFREVKHRQPQQKQRKQTPPPPDDIDNVIADAGPVLPTNGYDFKTRPYTPDTLKAALAKKVETVGNYNPSDKQRNLLGALLSEFYQGDDTTRYTASAWLFGAASTKEIDGSMIKVALDWLKPEKDDGGAYAIDTMAQKELSGVLDAAQVAQGQDALL